MTISTTLIKGMIRYSQFFTLGNNFFGIFSTHSVSGYYSLLFGGGKGICGGKGDVILLRKIALPPNSEASHRLVLVTKACGTQCHRRQITRAQGGQCQRKDESEER